MYVHGVCVYRGTSTYLNRAFVEPQVVTCRHNKLSSILEPYQPWYFRRGHVELGASIDFIQGSDVEVNLRCLSKS